MKKIGLDYGHGGRDLGASYKGRYEATDNLILGRLVANILRQAGVFVRETRTSDSYISLETRARLANEGDLDYFISIHRNAFRPETAKGVEVFVHQYSSRKSKALAQKIQKSLVELGFKNRGVKYGNFYLLRKVKLPSILIEVGFIDNSEDNRIFDEKLGRIAHSISQEILRAK